MDKRRLDDQKEGIVEEVAPKRFERLHLHSLLKASVLHNLCLERALPLLSSKENALDYSNEARESRHRVRELNSTFQSIGVRGDSAQADWLASYLRSVMALKAAIASAHPTSMSREIHRSTLQLINGYRVAIADSPPNEQLRMILKRHLIALNEFINQTFPTAQPREDLSMHTELS